MDLKEPVFINFPNNDEETRLYALTCLTRDIFQIRLTFTTKDNFHDILLSLKSKIFAPLTAPQNVKSAANKKELKIDIEKFRSCLALVFQVALLIPQENAKETVFMAYANLIADSTILSVEFKLEIITMIIRQNENRLKIKTRAIECFLKICLTNKSFQSAKNLLCEIATSSADPQRIYDWLGVFYYASIIAENIAQNCQFEIEENQSPQFFRKKYLQLIIESEEKLKYISNKEFITEINSVFCQCISFWLRNFKNNEKLTDNILTLFDKILAIIPNLNSKNEEISEIELKMKKSVDFFKIMSSPKTNYIYEILDVVKSKNFTFENFGVSFNQCNEKLLFLKLKRLLFSNKENFLDFDQIKTKFKLENDKLVEDFVAKAIYQKQINAKIDQFNRKIVLLKPKTTQNLNQNSTEKFEKLAEIVAEFEKAYFEVIQPKGEIEINSENKDCLFCKNER